MELDILIIYYLYHLRFIPAFIPSVIARSEATWQSIFPKPEGKMDCRASLAMTVMTDG
jgi:hypothetical protein